MPDASGAADLPVPGAGGAADTPAAGASRAVGAPVPGAAGAAEPDVPARPSRPRGVNGSIWALEHAQDLLSIVVGILLVLLAAAIIVSSVTGFVHSTTSGSVNASVVNSAAISLLDKILLVLILVEIVHTVVLSLRAHRLAAQPFIVIGLVAVIRRILFVLSNEQSIDATELGLLIAMVVAFVASLIAVRRFGPRSD